MLGDLIYEGKYRITNSRVLKGEETKIEHTITEEGRIKDINTTMLGTFWNVSVDKGVIYGEGHDVITTKDRKETATYKAFGIGRYNVESKGISFRGSVFYNSSSNGKLAFLNNMVGIFEAETDESGHGIIEIWEWK